ncbi:hypothetical protein E2C01_086719 [Portunus trituberculatus]|uniref:Uncharacterized protein n=1 Tax=Portunus trituberculatus TaxID=210409 RepID=A0A5B7JC70_PORTR|nr:hypothetical protein [Portunus trituberculatus]
MRHTEEDMKVRENEKLFNSSQRTPELPAPFPTTWLETLGVGRTATFINQAAFPCMLAENEGCIATRTCLAQRTPRSLPPLYIRSGSRRSYPYHTIRSPGKAATRDRVTAAVGVLGLPSGKRSFHVAEAFIESFITHTTRVTREAFQDGVSFVIMKTANLSCILNEGRNVKGRV